MRRRPALIAAFATLLLGGLGLWGEAATAEGPRLVEEAAVTWRDPAAGFGSWSGIVLDADGGGLIAVSDKGNWGRATLERAPGGTLTGVRLDAIGPLLDSRGQPVRRFDVDAEGLTIGGDGRIYISYEANHRVVVHERIDGPATLLPRPAEFRALQNNSGLEALFTGPDGRVHAIPERSGALARPYPVFRLDGEGWSVPFSIPRSAPHLVTGADLGPDGRLYLLERDFSGLLGFSTRVRRFELTPDGLSGGEVLLDSRTGRFDNLEGIDVWRDAQGRIRATMISDDNGSFFQVTQIVEFLLEGDSDAPGPRSTSAPRPRPRPDG
ncbi:esterase-like activity of phytase family protein [Rhodobacteraceae bacterium 2CG4]|uniref:Esterase-like activity of phytase family protein n=1 Tax=Halovulum marinum TaxID=2662447 RepID=A0A6L5YX54_9RHOB|nr:esterase-like activity of phytase family protein [Halovulum marinum]MSU88244.1 esterase-like activity of phytase family protein [Halovulum marinum]